MTNKKKRLGCSADIRGNGRERIPGQYCTKNFTADWNSCRSIKKSILLTRIYRFSTQILGSYLKLKGKFGLSVICIRMRGKLSGADTNF